MTLEELLVKIVDVRFGNQVSLKNGEFKSYKPHRNNEQVAVRINNKFYKLISIKSEKVCHSDGDFATILEVEE